LSTQPISSIDTRIPDDRARRGVGDRNGVGQDSLHALVGLERLAFFHADGGEETACLGGQHFQGLLLDHLVEVNVEGVVVGVDGVERLTGAADELHLRRVFLLGERVDAQIVDHVLFGHIETLRNGSPHEDPHVIGSRPDHEVPVRHLAFVAWREDEILAALSLVWTGRAHVLDIAEPGIVEGTEHARRRLEDRRTISLEIEIRQDVHGRCIPGQVERPGIHQLVEVQDLMAFHRALTVSAMNEPLQGGTGHALEKGLHTPHGVEIVVDLLGGFRVGRAIKKPERTDRSLDLVRSRDRLQNLLADLRTDRQAHDECDGNRHDELPAESEPCLTHRRFSIKRSILPCAHVRTRVEVPLSSHLAP
jgi:hypothetical protein